MRNFASNGYEALAMADMLYKSFHWQRFVVCYTTNMYGTYALQLWNTRAAALGLQTIATVPITVGVAVTNFTNEQVPPHLTYKFVFPLLLMHL